MKRELVVNIGPFENKIATIEDNTLVELFIHREGEHECVGNIYKGIVKDNVPGMAGSFINIGLERTALLHFRDAIPDHLKLDGSVTSKEIKEASNNDKKMGSLLKEWQEVMVQVEKAPIGKKGARLTGEVSIPGKYMVLIPNKNYVAISRKIHSNKEKKRLKKIVSKLKNKQVGLIVRTNAAGHKTTELKKEIKKLMEKWKNIKYNFKNTPGPTCLYDDNDLISLILKELIHKKLDSVILDSKKIKNKLVGELKEVAPQLLKKIKLFKEQSDIFDAFGIEKEIQKMFYHRIYLESGGFIVIQQAEALVSIDVNTGSFVGGKNLEKTVTTTNIDAAKEIARQIRLQDLTGMIFIDFIDMNKSANRRKVTSTFKQEMKKDYSPHKIFTSSPLDMVEMTRKRTKTDMVSSFFENCPYCHSVGRVLSKSTIVNNILRWLDRAKLYHPADVLEISVNPKIYKYAKQHENRMKKDYKFTWSLKMDTEIPYNIYKVYSIKSKKDITDLYKI